MSLDHIIFYASVYFYFTGPMGIIVPLCIIGVLYVDWMRDALVGLLLLAAIACGPIAVALHLLGLI